jgi:uncharacterized membrane protein
MRKGNARVFLAVAAALYVVLFTTLSIARYNTFHATTLDLGIMSQVTWNTAHGRVFETSMGRATNTELIGSYLGNHVRPILLLIAPLYRIRSDPRLLLVLQSAALGLAAVPLYHIASDKTNDRRTALIISACYLAYPALGFLNLVDFHPVALSIPLLFVAYAALEKKRMVLFWGAVVLALSTKEELVVPVAAWGVVSLLRRDRTRIGLGLIALAGVWAAVSFGVVIPHFNEGRAYRFWQLWSDLPFFPSQPAPQEGTGEVIGRGSAATVALFLVHLFLPLGFLPFVGYGALAVVLPSLAYLLLGQRPAFHSVGYQYPAVLIPWFFLAVVEGLKRLGRRGRRSGRGRLYRLGLAFLIIGTIGTNVALNPILLYAREGMFQQDPYQGAIEEALALIPPEAGVATINRFGPQLAHRRVLVPFEYPPPFRLDHVKEADYVLLDLVDCRLVPAADKRGRYAEMVRKTMEAGRYDVAFWSDRMLLLERGAPSEEKLAEVLAYVDRLVEQDRPCWP